MVEKNAGRGGLRKEARRRRGGLALNQPGHLKEGDLYLAKNPREEGLKEKRSFSGGWEGEVRGVVRRKQ